MSYYGYRTREPDEFSIEHEQGYLSTQLLQLHTEDLGYSFDELADALRTFPTELAEMHGLKPPDQRPKPKLKLVIGGEL